MIDREKVVSRHDIVLVDSPKVIPLGDGETAFGADRTGLQTFGGNTMCHWLWHSFPMPQGVSPSDIPETGTYMQGRLCGKGDDIVPPEKAEAARWMFDNPHIVDMVRVAFADRKGNLLASESVSESRRTLSLYDGILTTDFLWRGEPVHVETVFLPRKKEKYGRVAVRVRTSAPIGVLLSVPYPLICNPLPAPERWDGDFEEKAAYTTDFTRTDGGCLLSAVADGAAWEIGFSAKAGEVRRHSSHSALFLPESENFAFTVTLAEKAEPNGLLPFDSAAAETAEAWHSFWQSGGAMDFSGSTDERWFELERRVVVSQYLLRVQSAGSYPPSELGLTYSDMWRGQYHMEMIWWHTAHLFLWNRPELADEQLGVYRRFLPMAKKLAAQLGYRGAKWGKSVTDNPRTAPWEGNLALLWKQPHPIFLAELEYAVRPTQKTLEKWAEIIEQTAIHMADYAIEREDGRYHLDPVMPVSELGFTHDTVFDLAYWSWGLRHANGWRKRMGMKENAEWEKIASHMAPLPTLGDVYIRAPEWPETYEKQNYEHPDMVGICGMLDPSSEVDIARAASTVRKVWKTWDLGNIWGWDCAWISMCASRTEQPDLAIEALLKPDIDEIGGQGLSRGLYPYLPANGGILFAVAMLARRPLPSGWQVETERILSW